MRVAERKPSTIPPRQQPLRRMGPCFRRDDGNSFSIQFSNSSRYAFAFSRRIMPEVCPKPCPSKTRGSRECRVHAAPAVSCAKMCIENAHEHTGTVGTLRHSLRNGFTAYAVLSPATNSSCHRRWRISGSHRPVGLRKPPLNLTPATGARTTRFCRTHQRRSSCAPCPLTDNRPANTSRARRCRVHRNLPQRS